MDRPLRVLHAVVNMNRGGAETMIMNLYRNIDRTKIQFDFLTSKAGVFDEEIRQMGGRIHRIPYVTEAGPVRYFFLLKTFFNENDYIIVHAHMDKMSGQILAAAKQAGVPVRIAHSHNTSSEGSVLVKLYKQFAGSLIGPSATHLFACSEEAGKWLFGKKHVETVLMKNGIEAQKFFYSDIVRSRLRERLGFEEDDIILGHIGRFQKQKNHSFLIETFNELLQQQKQVYLLLIGDGEYKDRIHEQVRSKGIEQHVHFLGIREDIHELLQVIDLFVFPSLHEGLPLTLIEAQSAGVPCLVSDQITKEVDLKLNLVTFLPIHDHELWVREIQRIANSSAERRSEPEAIRAHGYDIHTTADGTQENYLLLGGVE